jgi:hypothetical protein
VLPTAKFFGQGDNFPEAVKIVVSALGYDEVAIRNGGYPLGYINTAYTEGIMSRSKPTAANAIVTRMDMAQLLYNALNTKVLAPTAAFGDGTVEYGREYTVLQKYFECNKGVGAIAADEFTNINGEEAVGRNNLLINNTVYTYTRRGNDAYAGNFVEFYYNDENEIISLVSYRTNCEEVFYDKISGVESNKIIYSNSEKTVKRTLSSK